MFSNIKRFMCGYIKQFYLAYIHSTALPAMIVCIVAWKLSLRSLCNDNSQCWKNEKGKKTHTHKQLPSCSRQSTVFSAQFGSFSIVVLLQFLFIIFNGCFVRRLTFYCYLMKWVWSVFCWLCSCAVLCCVFTRTLFAPSSLNCCIEHHRQQQQQQQHCRCRRQSRDILQWLHKMYSCMCICTSFK